jgi:hypothetical protein
MTIINKLASALNRRDQVCNLELAKQIAGTNDKKAVRELFGNLSHKNKGIQDDCIKVIYEIGTLKPALVAGYADSLIALFDSKNNRLQWGAMTALNTITNENHRPVYSSLEKIIAVAERGSVITNDHCVGILIKLCAIKEYADTAFTLLTGRLMISPANQLLMYAENALPVISEKYTPVFIKTLTVCLNDFEKETKRKRVEKVLKKLQEE